MSITAHCERCGQPASEWSGAARLWLCADCTQHFQQLDRARQELQVTLQPVLQRWWNRWRRQGLEGRDLEGQLATVFEQLTVVTISEQDNSAEF